MSHITQVKTEFNNDDAIIAAAESLAAQFPGVSLERDVKPRYWGSMYSGGESVACEFVLKLPGKYDLGLKKQGDGSYSMVCDNELLHGGFGANDAGRVLLGDNAGLFRQEYATERLRLLARKSGRAFNTEKRADGLTVVRISA